MILQALTQYYEKLTEQGKIARPGWARTKTHFALCIDEKGHITQVIPLVEDKDTRKPQPQTKNLPAPVSGRTVAIKANFLWDNSSYLLGIDAKGNPERTLKCFECSKALHHQLLDGIDTVTARGILCFFDIWNPEKADHCEVLKPTFEALLAGGNLLFRVNGVFAQEDEEIRKAWQKHYDTIDGNKQQCLVTGELDIIQAVHPTIKGVDGAQSSGAAIVSFNKPAFCSYGQEQNHNAPIGNYASFAYTAALNYLLADRPNVQKIGDTTVVCWAEGAEPQYQVLTMAALFGKEKTGFSEDDLKDAVRRLSHGENVSEKHLEAGQSFYILGLAPNAARLSVRFFYHDTFGNLMKNIAAHHDRMEIVHSAKDPRTTIPLWSLLRETVNPNSRDKSASPVMAGAVLRAIFNGGLYPAALLEQIMIRIKAERDINRGKAAIIKAYYLKNENMDCPKEVLTVALNESSTNAAYVLGRLFSVYEAVQQSANPGINTTIKDKYYNSASATPAMIFPLLDNLCQKHLRKLSTGSKIWFEKQIAELMGLLGDVFPARLSLPQQGSFNLGYYHQTQKRYEKKEDK